MGRNPEANDIDLNTYVNGWNECKEKVLQILNKHTQPIFDTELRKEDWEKVINLEAIKEIKKL